MGFIIPQKNIEINKLQLNNFTHLFVILFGKRDADLEEKLEDLSSFYAQTQFVLVDGIQESIDIYKPTGNNCIIFTDSMKGVKNRVEYKGFENLIQTLENELEIFQKWFDQKKQEMFQILDQKFATENKEVHIYIKGDPKNPQCKFTTQFLDVLRPYLNDFSHTDILLDSSTDIRNWNRLYSGWLTYPQLWISKKFVGGLDSCKKLFLEDKIVFPNSQITNKEQLIQQFNVLVVVGQDSQFKQIEQVFQKKGIDYFKYQDVKNLFGKSAVYINQKETENITEENVWQVVPSSNFRFNHQNKFDYLFTIGPNVLFIDQNPHELDLQFENCQLFNVKADQSLEQLVESISKTKEYPQLFKNKEFVIQASIEEIKTRL